MENFFASTRESFQFVFDNIAQIAVTVSAIAALLLYLQSKRTAQIKASFDHISTQAGDKDLIEIVELFLALRESFNGKLPEYNDAINTCEINGRLGRDIIKRRLNFYEVTAIGIRRGALNNKIIKEWWRGTFVADLRDAQGWIKGYRIQRESPKAYCEAYNLALKWANPSERANMDKSLKRRTPLFELWRE